MGAPMSTSFAASNSTSRCAERIPAPIISTAKSLCSRLTGWQRDSSSLWRARVGPVGVRANNKHESRQHDQEN
jgi:hypothetical protein